MSPGGSIAKHAVDGLDAGSFAFEVLLEIVDLTARQLVR